MQVIISDFSLKKLFKVNLDEDYKGDNFDHMQVEHATKLDDISEIQSIDLYLCESEKKPIFLIGTKGGYVFELSLKYHE